MAQEEKTTAKKTTAKKATAKKAPAKKEPKNTPKKPAGFPEPEQKDYTPEFVAECKARAEAGDAEGQAIYGRALSNGWGVEADAAAAVKWLRKAAKAGNAIGQTTLGLCYKHGSGVKADWATAAEWLRKAAEQGLPRAQFNLALCYAKGNGVEKDLAKAAEWFHKAAEQGDNEALELLNSLTKKKSVYRVDISRTYSSCVYVKAESPEAAERLAEASGAADLGVVDERGDWGDVEYMCDGDECNDVEPDIGDD